MNALDDALGWLSQQRPAMEEALYKIAPVRQFAGVPLTRGMVPHEVTLLNFRHLLGKNELAPQIFAVINAHLGARKLLLRQSTIVDRDDYPCAEFDEERRRRARMPRAGGEVGPPLSRYCSCPS